MCGKKPRREEISVEGDRKWQGRRPGVVAGNPQAIRVQWVKDLIQGKTGSRQSITAPRLEALAFPWVILIFTPWLT